MPEEAVKQRERRAKERTLDSLLSVYKLVIPVSKPVHYFCPKSNIFIKVELDELLNGTKEELIEFKKSCSKDTIIQVHLFKKRAKKPDIKEI